jgi:TolB-like protein
MRVRFAVLKRAVSTTVFLMIAGATTLPLPAQDLRQLASALADSISASGRKTAAVVDFTDLQGNATELGRFLAEELSAHLVSGAKGFSVMDRTQLKSMLRDKGLLSTGLMDPQTARKIGQIAGVDAIVTAAMTPLDAGVRIAAKVIDPSTAKVLGASLVEMPRNRAVAELMDRDAGGPAAAGTAYLNPNPGVRQLISASENDLLFSIDNCQKSADGISCMGSITSRYQTRRSIRLGAVLVDGKGNQYQAAAQIGSGREANATELWPKLPARFTVRARGASIDAGDVTLILSYTLWSDQGDRGAYVAWTKVALRNIPLSIPGS